MGSGQAIVAAKTDEPFRHLITVEEFLILDEAGAFAKIGRVELIEGEIYVMAALYMPHAHVLAELTIEVGLAARATGDLTIFSPVSARLDDHSLPEADILLAAVEPDGTFVEGAAVEGAAIRLAVEVAVSSLRHDLGAKARLYARTGVPEYWVADVHGRRLIRMHAPQGDAYTQTAEFTFGDPVPAATIPGLTVDTARLR